MINEFKMEIQNKESQISPVDVYRYSIFFRNYIESTAEDALKNGINLSLLKTSTLKESREFLLGLKVELKEALLEAMVSHRFNGAGYILVKPKGEDEGLSKKVNSELPTGFKYLDFQKIINKRESDYIEYLSSSKDLDGVNQKARVIKIEKSRVIIYENYDYVLGSHEPAYTQSLLLNICLLEQIYLEMEKRIRNYNFLFYKDEHLVGLIESLELAKEEISVLVNNNKGKIFSSFFKGQEPNKSFSALSGASSKLSKTKSTLNNDGIFYTASENASLEVIKYDLEFLKDAFELIKAKISADTKEPLTRSFNEQVKGLGSSGKGDKSNYYYYLKGVQESVANAYNIKLNKYYRLNMKFNELEVLSYEQRLERDNLLLDVYSKYLELIKNENLSHKARENLKEQLSLVILKE
ncbi:anti-CBASS protein Acb1 family protein [Borreliella garinii]|uniref:anti-CBASS protein Acb1 family protein n=1 Tax=Borreliella garinii TaxID=29519 RepID=UPI0005C729D1|nr:anti-CBASS Acb1 family protein [Borreliella garinii]